MKRIVNPIFLVVFYSIILLSTGIANAQGNSIEQLKSELVSQWLVTIDGESKTRTLKINGVAQSAADTYLLDADYGFSDGKQTAVRAEIRQISQERKLILTTQADSKIVATQDLSGAFLGTFTTKNGAIKALKITKLSPADLKAAPDVARSSAPAIEKASDDVPVTCAAFLGAWAGEWPRVGQVWLWVVGVDATCNAKYAYGKNSNPKSFEKSQIKDGALVISRPGGSTTFELQGDSLLGRYDGANEFNSSTMRRVNLSDGSLDRLRTEKSDYANIVVPAPEVPASCAAFSGKWTGTWSQGGIGQLWLWIASIDANCVAKIAYLDSNIIPSSYETVEIKDGTLKWICNKSTRGTCVIKANGDALYANYSNSKGGSNSAAFRKSQ